MSQAKRTYLSTSSGSKVLILCIACALLVQSRNAAAQGGPQLMVLGIAQDGGYPQAGCRRECCQRAWRDPLERRFVSCLALVDPASGQRWMFDCTPDFREQLQLLDQQFPPQTPQALQGILLTHAHVGHYAGLLHLGREVMGTQQLPVFCMPRMQFFLQTNGPWSQLVQLRQIDIQRLAAGQLLQLNERLSVTAIPVPHRDEFSETVAFLIQGPQRSALYLPDIDKWDKWETSIEDLIRRVDVAFVDATFFDSGELPGRDMSEIPHPLIVESLARFSQLLPAERAKIHFIHLNHSNPALDPHSTASDTIRDAGCQVAQQAEVFPL